MKILCTALFQKQLKTILDNFSKEDLAVTKSFKLYLDTIIINMPTKAHKYKVSPDFEDEKIKEIPHENFKIIFYEESNTSYLILSIIEN